MVSARGSALPEATQQRLVALQKVVKDAAATTNQADETKAEAAQKESDQAKRDFLNMLFESAPYWKYEQFL